MLKLFSYTSFGDISFDISILKKRKLKIQTTSSPCIPGLRYVYHGFFLLDDVIKKSRVGIKIG